MRSGRKRFFSMAALLAGGLLAAVTAPASTFLDTDIPTLRDLSDSVVVARVGQISSAWNDDETMIFTEVTLDVQRTLVGSHRKSVTVRVPGGTVSGYTVKMEGVPEFQKGRRVLVFLSAWDDGAPMITGYFMGLSVVDRDATGNEVLRGGKADGMPLGVLVRDLRGQGR